MHSRRGFTLIEALIAMVVITLVGLITVPKVSAGLTAGNVLAGRNKLVTLYARARAVAMETGRTGILVVNGNNAYVVARPRSDAAAGVDTITKVESMYTQYKLTVTATTDSARVGPSGIGLNADTIIVSKSGKADTVFIGRFGQVSK